MSMTATRKYAALVRETRSQWKGWAQALAAGGPSPSPLDILTAAGILRVAGPPAEELEADAEAIGLVAALEVRVAEIDRKYEALVAEHGGREGIAEKVEAATRELERLKAIRQRIVGGSGSGYHRQELEKIQSKHPRIWEAR